MHKRILLLLSFVGLFLAAFLPGKLTTAENSSPWISAPLVFQRQADIQAIPASLNGNIDCAPEDNNNCSVPTTYGAATQNGTIRLDGDDSFKPVFSYVDNHQHFLPIPNSSTAITYTTEPAYGLYLYFNYNFPYTLTSTSPASGQEYHVSSPPNSALQDKANHRLAADYNSMSFSQDGVWMVVSDPNTAMLRVNLLNFDVVPFAPGFNYAIGLDPSVKTAITNDGRYAFVASKNFNFFRVYDLSTCSATPLTISGPVSCVSRDLHDYMYQKLPGFSFISSGRFLDDGTLSIYATYNTVAGSKTARVIISTENTPPQIEYLALGDSYISGEGAFDYQGGTDTDTNKCHLSLGAYPYLLGHDLGFDSYHSVACSGAVNDDITNASSAYKGQAQNKSVRRDERSPLEIDSIFSSFKPGYIDQLDFVSRYQPKIITLSVGGNDMGFSPVLKACAQSFGTCYSSYEDRLELVREINSQVYPKLARTYIDLKNAGPSDMRFYVIGYPQIAKAGGNCALNVHLNNDEIKFSQQLISYLDSVIELAAAKAGVYYVDTQDALNGHRLCEAGPGSVAVNGLTAGNDQPKRFGGPIGNESYHPNVFGYQLLENKILAASHGLALPAAGSNGNGSLAAEASLEILNAPHSGRTVNQTTYESGLTPDSMDAGSRTGINISGRDFNLAPSSTVKVEIHSDPTELGAFTSDSTGNIAGQIIIPADAPTGYHSLHFYGTRVSGQPVDIYKMLYVSNPATDNMLCGGVELSGQDFDQDGVDDACDGTIDQPPQSSTTIGLQANSLAAMTPIRLTSQSSQNSGEPAPGSSPTDARQSGRPQVLAEATESLPKSSFKPGWLLAGIPAILSLTYFFKSKP